MATKKKVKVRFLQDDEDMKKGKEILMSLGGAKMYEKEGVVEILPEEKKEDRWKKQRKKEAKFWRDKHVMEQVGINKLDAGTSIKMLGVDPDNYTKIKNQESKNATWTSEDEKLIKKYLKKKNIFDEITEKELDKQIVGEIPTRKVIFLCSQGRLVKNAQTSSYNLLITSAAGSGKDYIASKVLSLLPKEKYIKKTRISGTAFTYWHNSNFEPEWTWDGKVCYLEDISDAILNHEVFKVMTSEGSSATVVIKQRAHEIDINGKPVMVTTTATATPIPEITRRFEFCNLDESIDQTKEIMKRHAMFAKKGINPTLNEEIPKALNLLDRVKVKIPYADKLDSLFPENNIMMRTKFPRFLDFIKASCAFHQYQRKKCKEGYLLATKQDYEIAKLAIEKLSTNKFLVPLTTNQQKIMAFFEQNPHFFANSSEILIKIGHILALKNLKNNLNLLVSYNLLEKKIEKDSLNRDIEMYGLAEHLRNSNDVFELPPLDKINKKEKKR